MAASQLKVLNQLAASKKQLTIQYNPITINTYYTHMCVM